MSLTHPVFIANDRIRRAAVNSPPMSRGEPDRDAVKIMQQALLSVGAATLNRSFTNGEPDGIYGTETIEALRRPDAGDARDDPFAEPPPAADRRGDDARV